MGAGVGYKIFGRQVLHNRKDHIKLPDREQTDALSTALLRRWQGVAMALGRSWSLPSRQAGFWHEQG